MKEIIEKAKDLLAAVATTKPMAQLERKQKRLSELTGLMSAPDFWADNRKASETAKEAADLEKEIANWEQLDKEVKEILALAEAGVKEDDESMTKELTIKLQEIGTQFEALKFITMMDGEYNRQNAILSIHAGAGGTDAQDWAEMLMRMYLRYAEKAGFKATILDKSDGAEAGIKSATVEFKGKYAYGYLKAEAGVHRLVRISPFDAEKMRHTSFALVEVLPEIEELSDQEMPIKTEDLRIDVFRSSGHGGQSVNTTDSAVRIKHLPTGITVSCQNERSQLQNKETAMKVLRSKLYQYYQTELEEERQRIRGEFNEAAWGNQARSYVIHPYKMVKDHRSEYETQEVEKVLDGDLQALIEAELGNRKVKK
ncbi:MAG TPA: peptide chain release factor 2 [Patescibacteria group bacterium]|nr:peptide chain release factor 2 [Patescibacteria group bacterium]